MAKTVFKNDDIFERLQFRDWIRHNCNESDDGFVAEDVDLVIRTYGGNFETDEIGKVMLIEIKHSSNARIDVGTSKTMTFGLIDKMIRASPCNEERYLGYFLLVESDSNWDVAIIHVNGVLISDGTLEGRIRLRRFLHMDKKALAHIKEEGFEPISLPNPAACQQPGEIQF